MYPDRRLLSLGFVMLAIILVLSFLFSSPLRVYARDLFFRIGNLLISDEATYAEQMETALQSGETDAGSVLYAPPVEWQAPPLLSLEEARVQAGFDVYEIIEAPAGFTMTTRHVLCPDDVESCTKVITTYLSGEDVLTLSQTLFDEDSPASTLPVGDSPVTEVEIQEARGLWIEDLRLSTTIDENDRVVPKYANVLTWENDGFEFWLQTTPGMPLEKMLPMAESIAGK